MLKIVWEWIRWVIAVMRESSLALIGLAVSGVLGYFVIRFLIKKMWNIMWDISDDISDMMDE